MRKAFTMIELVFVIVVIGILAVVAVPKLAPVISDAQIAKGKATLAAVRSALSTERQKQILRGKFNGITSLRGNGSGIFSTFNDANGSSVLEYDVASCTHKGCWVVDSSGTAGVDYIFKSSNGDCKYKLENNRFVDKTTGGCTDLEGQ
jgi:general secretion pathway protein G